MAQATSLSTLKQTQLQPKGANNLSQTTLKLLNAAKKGKDQEEYYDDYDQYDSANKNANKNKAGDEEELEVDDTESDYTELNDHLLTKRNETSVKHSISEEASLLSNVVAKKVVIPSPDKFLPDLAVSSTPSVSSKVQSSKNANSNLRSSTKAGGMTKAKANDEDYYDYGQEDYYQLAAGDLKTVKDGTLPVTLPDTLLSIDNTNINTNAVKSSTEVVPVQQVTSSKTSDNLKDILKELMTPTIRLIATTTTTTTTQKIPAKR